MSIECRAREFKTYEDASEHAMRRAGAVLRMPGREHRIVTVPVN